MSSVIRAREQIPSRNSTSETLTPADVSLFVEKSHPVPATTAAAKKPANKPTITPAEAQRLNRERTDAVIRGFKRLKEIDPGEICSEGEEVAGRWTEWLSVADALVEIFDSEKRLHVTDRVRPFSHKVGLLTNTWLSIKGSKGRRSGLGDQKRRMRALKVSQNVFNTAALDLASLILDPIML